MLHTATAFFLRHRPAILIGIITLAAFLLRFCAIHVHSLWWDELQSMRTADPANSYSDILTVARQSYDPAPRTFYFLLNTWFSIFGYNDFTARLFTVLFGVAAIPVMYALGKQLQDKTLGFIVASISAVNYALVFYSVDVRFYSLLFFFSAFSYLYFLKAINRSSILNLVLYGLATFLLISVHYFGLLILVTQGLTWIFLIRRTVISQIRSHMPMLLTFVVILLCYLPFLQGLLQTMQTDTAALSGNPDNDFFLSYFKAYFGYSGITVYPAAIALLFFTVVAFTGMQEMIPRRRVMLILLWLLLPVAMAYTRTLLGDPTMGERYFMIVLPVLLLMVAMGIRWITSPVLRYAFLFFYAAACILSLTKEHRFYSGTKKDDFRGVAFYITNKENGHPFYILSDKNWHFKYYFDQQKAKVKYIDHQDYADGRFYVTTHPVTQDELINDSSIGKVWIISAHFANLEKMKNLSAMLETSGGFTAIDSFESRDAFARLLSRTGIRKSDTSGMNLLPSGELVDMDGEKLFPFWSGELLLNSNDISEGEQVLKITAIGTAAGNVYPEVSVYINDKKAGSFIAGALMEKKEFHFSVKASRPVIRLVMENDLYDEGASEDRNVFFKAVVVEGG